MRFRIALCIVSLALLLYPTLTAKDKGLMADRLPHWTGPGFTLAAGGNPPLTFSSNGVQLLSWLPLPSFGSEITSASTVEGYVSGSGTEYALLGISHGIAYVRLSDPGNPQILQVNGPNKYITGPTSLWKDIRTYGHHAYAVSEGGSGIQVMDLSQIDSNIVTLVNTVTSGGGTTATHTVFINQESGFLYRCGGGGSPYQGLRIYSLADPANPVHVGTWNNRYVHESQVVSYTTGPFAGKEVAFAYSEDTSGGVNAGIDILDVTNKANIQSLSFLSYPDATFSHQGWLSPDRRFLYQDDELDENQHSIFSRTRVFNVENLENPFFVGFFSTGTTSIDHNLYTKGNLIFESNYRSGLRIFDATNPISPVEIAFFDTYPEDDFPAFNSLWDNDPYLPSGIVLGSDIEKGLFIWWVGPPMLSFQYPNGIPDLLNPPGSTLAVQIQETVAKSLLPGSEKLFYKIGNSASFTEVALHDISGNLFEATFPAAPCGESVSFYISAKSTNGISWRDPPTAPASVYQRTAAHEQNTEITNNMENPDGWVAGAPGDTATTGLWTRVNPNGTTAQPEDDHTAGGGTVCWVTGQGSIGGGVGENDIDGGKTTLTTSTYNLTGMNLPRIGYWRWYSNSAGGNPGADFFTIDISNNNGSSWVNVETVGPSGEGTMGGWFYHDFLVSDFVTPNNQIKMRFVAEDGAGASAVEAAIDDFQILSFVCFPDCNLNQIDDAQDIAAGSSFDCNLNGVPDECTPGATWNPPGRMPDYHFLVELFGNQQQRIQARANPQAQPLRGSAQPKPRQAAAGNLTAEIKVLAKEIAMGGNGPAVPVRLEYQVNGGSFQNTFGGSDLQVGNTSNIDLGSGGTLTLKGRSAYPSFADPGFSFQANSDSNNAIVFQNGDDFNEMILQMRGVQQPFNGQMKIACFVAPYFNLQTGKIQLPAGTLLVLFELGTADSGSPAYDFQDLVILVTPQ